MIRIASNGDCGRVRWLLVATLEGGGLSESGNVLLCDSTESVCWRMMMLSV